MANTIKLKKSSVAAKIPLPGDLDYGELAINYTDGNLFFKSNANVVTTLASTKFVSVTGNVTGNYFIGNGSQLTGVTATPGGNSGEVQFNNAGSMGGSSNFTFDGTNVTVTGNVQGGNLRTTGIVSATGNITGAVFSGNGSGLSAIAGANVTGTVASATSATTAVTVTNATQSNITAVGTLTSLSVSGTITGGNLELLAVKGVGGTANVYNITSQTTVSATGNVTGGNVLSSGLISTSGNISAFQSVTGSALSALGNVTGSNVVATFSMSSTGNVTGGNVLTGGLISATGNITGAVFIGNGSGLSAIAGANVTGTVASATSATSATTAGTVTNATQGNITAVGTLTSLSVSGTVQGGNLQTAGIVSATGNVTGGNVLTAGLISATGNITGGNILGGANVNATTHTGTTVSVTANITGGNVLTGGLISATGNVTGAFFIGNGSQLTGVVATSVGTLASLSVTGNTTSGNLSAVGLVSAATITTSGNVTVGGDLVVNGNTAYINITDLNVEDPIIGLGRGPNNTPLIADDGKDRGEQLWYYDTQERSAFIGWDDSAAKLIAASSVSIANEIVTVNSYGTFVVGALEATTVSASGNVTGGNLLTAGLISATGNITGGNLSGTLVTGTLTTAAQPNITSVGTLTSLSVTGNVSAGNVSGTLLTGTLATAAQPNVTSVGTLTSLSVTGNVTGGNIATAGRLDAGLAVISTNSTSDALRITQIGTGNALVVEDEANPDATPFVVSSTGNLGIGIGNPNVQVQVYNNTGGPATIRVEGQASVTNNIHRASNDIVAPTYIMLKSRGTLAARANVATDDVLGQFNFTGYGGTNNRTLAYITGEVQDYTSDTNMSGRIIFGVTNAGTAPVEVVRISANGTITATGGINATGNVSGGNISGTLLTGTLATAAQPNVTSVGTLTSLNVTGNVSAGNVSGTLLTGTLATAAQPNVTSVGTLTSLTVTGNITTTAGNVSAGNLLLSGNIVDTGNITITSSAANAWIFLTPTGTGTIQIAKDITNGQANGVGNIGNATGYFNTVFAKATSAQYADLAEYYRADAEYPPGTVVVFGGRSEVTQSTLAYTTAIAGVISESPAYVMNAGLKCKYPAAVAMIGRVPCRVTGPVAKGDLLVASDIPGTAQRLDRSQYQPGCVIGKALENHRAGESGIIEIAVGRL